MGVRSVRDVDLIRHTSVQPGRQRRGIGSQLLQRPRRASPKRMLVSIVGCGGLGHPLLCGHGFTLVSPAHTAALLTTYWRISKRQIELSVVLANPPDDRA